MAYGDIRTPYLLLDETRMERNIARVSDQARKLGVTLRPHFKTPKALPILERMISGAGDGRVTVSTLREADYLAASGYTDLLLTTPLSPHRVDVIADLAVRGAQLTVVLDSLASTVALIEAAAAARRKVAALIELNVDDYRGGIDFGDDGLARVVDHLRRASEVEVRGVLVYPGASSRLTSDADRADLGRRHRDDALRACKALRAAGLSDEVRSFGSTSVLMAMDELRGMTEHRGGIYVFQDLHQAGLGWCERHDISLTVAATVVSHDMHRNRVFIDAGALALSKDRSTSGTPFDACYGWLVEPADGEPIGDLLVEQVFQEHGVVTSASRAALPFHRLAIGTIVAIQVNHADITAAAYDHYHLARDGKVVERIDRINGW